jgi:hypothetical protein
MNRLFFAAIAAIALTCNIAMADDSSDRLAMGRYTDHKAEFDQDAARVKEALTERDAVVGKLERALTKDDEGLLDVAISDAFKNRKSLLTRVETLVNDGKNRFMYNAASVYKAGLITEEKYTEHLDTYRAEVARATAPPPAKLNELMAKAKAKNPRRFEISENVWGRWDGI